MKQQFNTFYVLLLYISITILNHSLSTKLLEDIVIIGACDVL